MSIDCPVTREVPSGAVVWGYVPEHLQVVAVAVLELSDQHVRDKAFLKRTLIDRIRECLRPIPERCNGTDIAKDWQFYYIPW